MSLFCDSAIILSFESSAGGGVVVPGRERVVAWPEGAESGIDARMAHPVVAQRMNSPRIIAAVLSSGSRA